MVGCRLAALFACSCCVAASGAQILELTETRFAVHAEGLAIGTYDVDGSEGVTSAGTHSASAHIHVSETDPDLGEHYGIGSASFSWSVTTSGQTTTLSGGVGSLAESFSNGLDAWARAWSSLSHYFTVDAPAVGTLQSEGTYNSDLYIYDGTDYVPFYTGLNGSDQVAMDAGRYRWDSAVGEWVTGSASYSSGISFTVSVAPVPEPGTWLTLAVGAWAAWRKRSPSPS